MGNYRVPRQRVVRWPTNRRPLTRTMSAEENGGSVLYAAEVMNGDDVTDAVLIGIVSGSMIT